MNLNALNTASSPNYSIDQILQTTQGPSQPGAFRRILGGVVGGVGNMFAPGLGSMIGNAISGGVGGLVGNTMQYLQLQQKMNAESEAFETASAVMKSRHDASMAAIRNIS
jgi:uncharacterized protein YcfJ